MAEPPNRPSPEPAPESAPGTAPNPPILYLDVDDEITSAAARIRRLEGNRAAIVVPFGSRLATSRINFRLLAREATERGVAIEIVAADASARALAVSAGLTVHPSVAAFEGRESSDGANGSNPASGSAAVGVGGTGATLEGLADEDAPTKVLSVPTAAGAHPALAKPRDKARVPLVGPARPPIRARMAAALAVAVLAIVAVGAWAALFVLPSATISLAPRSADAGPLELTVEARPDVTAPDAAALLIPARNFTFDLEVSDSFPATGVKVTETKASGNVTFSNFDNGKGVVITAGTTVRTEDGIEFLTVADVTLPRARQDFFPPFSTHPSTGSVGVRAVIAGTSGNVGQNTIVEVPGGGRNLFVTNEEVTTGGTHQESPRVSQEDVDAAQAALQELLQTELDTVAAEAADVPPGTRLFAETGVVGDATPTVDPASLVGTDAAEFELGLTATGSVLGVDPAPLDAVAVERLSDRIPDGWQVAAGSIAVMVGEPTVLGESVTFPVSVRATQVRVVDREMVISEARGLQLAEARARLEAYGDVEIRLWPDWVTNVPDDPSKVSVEILEPRPETTPEPGP